MKNFTKSEAGPDIDLANPAAVRKRIRASSPRALMRAVLAAFDQVGGVGWLVRQAEHDPRGFLTLLARVLPRDVRLETDARAVIDELIQRRRGLGLGPGGGNGGGGNGAGRPGGRGAVGVDPPVGPGDVAGGVGADAVPEVGPGGLGKAPDGP